MKPVGELKVNVRVAPPTVMLASPAAFGARLETVEMDAPVFPSKICSVNNMVE
jgi:hypothetical protein